VAANLQLTSGQLSTVLDILHRIVPDREVQVFGSRARGQAKPYSDLDLVVMGDSPLSLGTLSLLSEAFAESDLPWRVDVVDWASTSAEFRQHIASHSLPLNH
jgi:type I restriction enzyme S subunit